MTRRIAVVALTLLLGAGAVEWLSRAEARVARAPLAALPLQIGGWAGRDNPEFDAKVVAVLGVDDYINRSYAANAVTVSLYIGYYETQRTGETIHSPMKCLPGTGWQPLATGRKNVTVDGPAGPRTLEINRYLVQKGSDRYLVLFWYQTQGHVIASEYVAKLRLMTEAVRVNRTDGALVRVMLPLPDGEAEQRGDDAAAHFIQALFPLLERHLPS